MVNAVYRKIRESCAEGMNPRGPIAVNRLACELNISPVHIRQALAQLIDQRLVLYYGKDKQFVKLTLLGATVSR